MTLINDALVITQALVRVNTALAVAADGEGGLTEKLSADECRALAKLFDAAEAFCTILNGERKKR